jgi:hypothetical protein
MIPYSVSGNHPESTCLEGATLRRTLQVDAQPRPVALVGPGHELSAPMRSVSGVWLQRFL